MRGQGGQAGRLDAAFREAAPRIVAALAARFRDLDLAEEAFAEACAAATAAWPGRPPSDPAAWLYATAVRKALDALRRRRAREHLRPDKPEPEPSAEEALMAVETPIPDDRLRLVFVCCHPALAPEARVALTLRTVGGLSVRQVAEGLLASEATVAQRLVRAKRKIREAGVPFEVPERALWPERLEAVLATFEIAYAQAYGDAALAGEGAGFGMEVVRMAGVLAELLPDEPEVLAFSALVQLAEARRRARLDEHGAMVPLAGQEVELWDARLSAQGEALLARAAALGRPGPYQLMAALHAAHASRARTGRTPWAAILALYDALGGYRPGPVTAVNRAVALAEVDGPAAGLAALEAAAAGARLDGWSPYQAARAALLARTGAAAEARRAYQAALDLGPPPAERLYLQAQLAALG